MLEHGAYTLLIDACYDRERFPSLDEAIEWTWARTDEEIAAVRFVLTKFFMLRDGVYTQERIHEEIAKYHENSATNKRIAQDRENKRRTNRTRNVNEAPPNQEPITNNQEPVSTLAGEVCKAIKALGLSNVNPGHVKLVALLEAGATLAEFTGAAQEAIGKNKGTFSYVLAIVEGRRKEIKGMAGKIATGSLEKPWYISGWSKIEEMGKRQGIIETRELHGPLLKAAIFKKYQITAEMERKAQIEFGEK